MKLSVAKIFDLIGQETLRIIALALAFYEFVSEIYLYLFLLQQQNPVQGQNHFSPGNNAFGYQQLP